MQGTVDNAMGMLVGLAVGDALGAPLEFQDPREPDDYITKYHTGGIWNVKKGEWTDDTAMAFAMGSAIRAEGAFDADVIMQNFCKWYFDGAFIPRGVCFDIGTTTVNALRKYADDPSRPYAGSTNPKNSGNGALMRIAPIVLCAKSRDHLVQLATQQTLLTHGTEMCVLYSRMFAEELYAGSPLQNYTSFRHPIDIDRKNVMSGGYVKETYEAAMWAFQTTNNFEDCVIAAVNRGHDSDTTGAVAGMIAGAHYGIYNIPKKFTQELMWHDKIQQLAIDLYYMGNR